MKRIALTVAAAAAAACAQGGLRISWDFDSVDQKGRVANAAKGGQSVEPLMNCGIRPGAGVGGSNAAYVEKGRVPQCAFAKLDYAAFTLDMRFSLAKPLDSRHGACLFSYSWAPWKRGNFMVRILRDGRLEVRFVRPAAGDGSFGRVDFSVASEPLRLAQNVLHAIRVACDAQGRLTLYCDGAKVAEKSGAPGLKGIEHPHGEWYPLIRLGANDDDTQNMTALLNGFVDDVEIYDEALGAPAVEVENVDYSGIAAVEYRAGTPNLGDVLVPGADGVVRTGKFRVNDREEGALGNWVRADRKFLDHASTATLKMDAKKITAVITCPVPPGMSVRKSTKAVWSGDEVELFIRPDLASDSYHQYMVNAGGLSRAIRYDRVGVVDKSHKSAFKASVRDLAGGFEVTIEIPREEVFARLPEDGDVFAVNFARTGATCGGISTWADVGRVLNNPQKFGKVIWGGSRPYFEKRLAAAKAEADAFTGRAGDAAARAYRPLAAAVAAHASDPSAFSSLERMFADYRQAMIAISLAGRSLLVFRPANPWGDAIEPTKETRPLGAIRIRAARNAKTWYALAVKNMTDREFLGQVKVFDKDPGYRFAFEGTHGVARHFSVSEAVPTDIGGGTLSHDPLVPLPMGTLLRIAPRGASMLWLELDTRGLATGAHYAKLCVKKARAGFDSLSVSVEVEVTGDDLDAVKTDMAAYDWLSRNQESAELMRFAAANAGNVMCTTSWKGAFSAKRKDGSWSLIDCAPLDRKIEARIAGGVPRDRLVVWYCIALNLYWNAPRGVNGDVLKPVHPDWRAGLKATVTQLYAHLREKYGLRYDQLIFYVVDEPSANDPLDDPELKNSMAIAYHGAKTIKEADPKLVTFANPHTHGGAYEVDQFCKTLKRMEECFDIVEFYRPNVTPELVARLKDFKFEYWTYNIVGTSVPPDTYCADVWRNMRDGFRELTPFWHLDSMAGWDGFDPTDRSSADTKNYSDYGAVYVDYDNGKSLLSRRFIAYLQGVEDSKLIRLLRAKFVDAPEKLARVDAIVRKAADAGTMLAIDEARSALLSIGGESPGR